VLAAISKSDPGADSLLIAVLFAEIMISAGREVLKMWRSILHNYKTKYVFLGSVNRNNY
jgi:hypothetical protein